MGPLIETSQDRGKFRGSWRIAAFPLELGIILLSSIKCIGRIFTELSRNMFSKWPGGLSTAGYGKNLLMNVKILQKNYDYQALDFETIPILANN